MRHPLCKTVAAAAVLFACASGAQAAEAACEVNGPVNFGGMNWESNLVVVEIERFIMEKGYGCKTEVLPTETLPALAALERGDLDINSEIWLNSVADPWEKALKSGKVKRIGEVFMGGEAWFVPRYTAERLPELKSAADLPKFKDEFSDPEEPSKGRFYGCPAGWGCEVVSTNLFHALKLDDTYTLYSPGTGAAQKAALTAAYKRKQNVVFYYWYPTPLVGSMDLVKLDLPPYDETRHKCLTAPKCANPEPSAYPQNPVFTAVNTEFSQKAPRLADFLSKVAIPNPVVDQTLAHMEESGDEARDVAQWFLKNKADVWTKWVDADVAKRVQAEL
ncbi:ABC transporter substrate-binding protein [Bordetella genomosp. 13]|uniref:ABC transporter substrate-binding protein n=1 Tax=Bordetella genomosp. 13 TaxID=463040 RepID=UPI0011A0A05C|nr:ABC transporter substrate-binding protein [Bordetella genomosp. 13]